MSGLYVEKFIKYILDNSISDNWEEAVMEWEIIDCIEDEYSNESCICGKENLKYQYTIRNRYNKKEIFPIGSSCIKKFDREDFKEEMSITEGMFKLLHAVEKNKYLTLSSEFFTRKILLALYDEGAFKDNEYNNYNGYSDYEFLVKMFNKRNKEKITERQNKKISAIILTQIRPFLLDKLENKIKR